MGGESASRSSCRPAGKRVTRLTRQNGSKAPASKSSEEKKGLRKGQFLTEHSNHSPGKCLGTETKKQGVDHKERLGLWPEGGIGLRRNGTHAKGRGGAWGTVYPAVGIAGSWKRRMTKERGKADNKKKGRRHYLSIRNQGDRGGEWSINETKMGTIQRREFK